jgi:UDP-N-acetylmuramoyl-L-alanyl-D-glutamate--2,6-diaminopimelate ligase
VDLHLVGRFNVHNALAVVALGEAIGLDPAAVREGLAAVPVVPGRMERVDLGQPFGVIVDFAHSPASLQAVLDLLAPLAASRDGGLIAVFGSAGERDTAKRPLMGRIAWQARVVW